MSKLFSVFLAIIGITFAIYFVKVSSVKQPTSSPLNEPSQNSSYIQTIAGAGIVEAAGRNSQINPPLPGQVAEIYVKENEQVQVGQPLFKIDDREQRARINSAEANIARAQAVSATAQMDITTQQAAEQSALANVEQLQSLLIDAEDLLKSNEKLSQDGVVPRLTYTNSLNQRNAAQARVKQAEAQVAQTKTLINSAQARLKEAEANLKVLQAERDELKVTLDRLIVKAPKSGRILQLNIRLGEYIASTATQPAILLGETDMLQVRADIDEINASKITPGNPAVAYLKGDSSKKIPLEFMRIDPYILPKKSLTGDNSERVDVRVLQVVYTFHPTTFPVYVGQQVDVFIDATPAVATNSK